MHWNCLKSELHPCTVNDLLDTQGDFIWGVWGGVSNKRCLKEWGIYFYLLLTSKKLMCFRRIYQENWHIAQHPVHHSYVLLKLNSSFSVIVLSSLVYPYFKFDIEQDAMHKPLNWEGASISSLTVSQVMQISTIYCYSLQTCSIWATNFLFILSRHFDQQLYKVFNYSSTLVKWNKIYLNLH